MAAAFRRHPALLRVVVAVATVVVGALLVVATRSSAQTSASARPVVAPATSSATPTTDPSANDLVQPSGDGAAVPARIRIRRLGINSALERLRTGADGRLQAPSRWQRAGWFADGTRPGNIGPAVIAAHVDSPSGPAVFARLPEARPGDRIDVETADGRTVAFRVDRTQLAEKRRFPTRSVYGPTPDAELRLITCDGPYVESSGGYRDNLIVYVARREPPFDTADRRRSPGRLGHSRRNGTPVRRQLLQSSPWVVEVAGLSVRSRARAAWSTGLG